jgi:hypothetical protein
LLSKDLNTFFERRGREGFAESAEEEKKKTKEDQGRG